MAAKPVLLELDLAHGLLESAPADPIAALRSRGTPVLADVVKKLREASGEDGVGGLIAHVGPEVLDAAQVEELGAAVEAFAAAGKRTICWTEAFGETGNGTLGYHLAAHFDEIWLQPSGGLAMVGTATGGLFLRGALKKLGVEPQVHARHEYKNAPDTLLREAMGDAQREALQRMTDSITEQVIATVARRRRLTPEAVRAAIADAPLTSPQAAEFGFVDHVGYRDEAYTATRRVLAGPKHSDTADDDLPEVTLRYIERWSPPKKAALKKRVRAEAGRRVAKTLRRPQAKTIAVVGVEGGIMLGRSGGSPLGGPNAGSDSICAALRQAGRSDEVAAVVLRVSSPGGSYVASDAVHREVLRLRAGGTPVVASMGAVAASGGYFVAMGADEILALPSTITGSIGVFAGKIVAEEGLRRIGVKRELVETGEQSTMWAGARPFSSSEIERLDRWLDDVYDDFTRKAAEGRGLPHAQLEPLARGRVWTGADAKERGLVDRLGGLEEAVAVAAERAGLTRAEVEPRRFPDASPLARLRPPRHSDAPNAALGTGWLADAVTAAAGSGSTTTGLAAGLAALALEGVGAGPERLLAELGLALGVGPGALRLPGNWQLLR